MKLRIIIFWFSILILLPVGLLSKSLSSKSKEYSSDSENFNAQPEPEQSVVEENEAAFHDNYRPRHKVKTIMHRPRYHRSDFDVGNEQADHKTPQCAVMYKDNEPVGVLQPFEESYRFIPVSGDSTLVDLNPIPPVKRMTLMDLLYPSKVIDDDYTDHVAENTNQFADDRYPSIFAKFKIDSRLDRSMNPDLNMKRSMFKRGLESERASIDQESEDLKSTPSQIKAEDSGVVEEELKNILDDMGIIDDYGDKEEIKRQAEDENLEMGTNKISIVKEEDKEKREKRNFITSTVATSLTTAFAVDGTGFPMEGTSDGGPSITIPPPTKAKFEKESNEEAESVNMFNAEPAKVDDDDVAKASGGAAKVGEYAAIATPDSSTEAEMVKIEPREKRQLDNKLADDKKENKRNLAILTEVNALNAVKDAKLNLDKDADVTGDRDADLSVAKEAELNEAQDAEVNGAKYGEINDDEKRVEREIRDKIQKLKDEVRQEIDHMRLKDVKIKNSLLSELEEETRKKRQAVNTLVDEESVDIDPTLDDGEKGKTHVRRKRSLDVEFMPKLVNNSQEISGSIDVVSNSYPSIRTREYGTHICGEGCSGQYHNGGLIEYARAKNAAYSTKYLDEKLQETEVDTVNIAASTPRIIFFVAAEKDEKIFGKRSALEDTPTSSLGRNIDGTKLTANNSDTKKSDLKAIVDLTNYAGSQGDFLQQCNKERNQDDIRSGLLDKVKRALRRRNVHDRLTSESFENGANGKTNANKRFLGLDRIVNNLMHCSKCNASAELCNHNLGRAVWLDMEVPGADVAGLGTDAPSESKTNARIQQNSAPLEENFHTKYQSRGLKQYRESSNDKETEPHPRVKREDDSSADVSSKDGKDYQSVDPDLDSVNSKKRRNLDDSEDNAYQYDDSEFNSDNSAYGSVTNEKGNENQPMAKENGIAQPDILENDEFSNAGKSCHCDKNGNNCKCGNLQTQLNNMPNVKQYEDYGVDPEAGFMSKKAAGQSNGEKGEKHCKCPQEILGTSRIKQQYSDYMEDQSEEKLENPNDGESVNEFAFPKLKIPRHAIEARKNVLSPFGKMEYLPELEREHMSDEAAFKKYYKGDLTKREAAKKNWKRLTAKANFRNGQYFVDMHPEVYRLSPIDPSREKRENLEDLVAIHGGGPVRSHLVAIKQRSMLPHSRFRRRVLGDDNRLPRQLIDMSDEDLFGALPQSFAGELMRYKRVKRAEETKT